MKKKILILGATVAGCIVVVLLIVGIKALQIQAMMKSFANFTIPPESVASSIAVVDSWTPELKAVGSTAAVQGVMVSTDLSGIVAKINFESGQTVKQGDLLVQLDVHQEIAQLQSAQAQQKLASMNLQRQQNLLKGRVSSQADFDAAQAGYDQAEARVKEVQALIDKKTITAPFSGVLGIRLVNLGQYLESGANVVSLQALDPIYVNFWLPQQDLGRLTTGQAVRVTSDALTEAVFEGKLNAVDSVVDEATRNVRVQATLANPDKKLRPGMYVNVAVDLPDKVETIFIPATAIQYAPYGDFVFIIEDMTDAQGKTYKGVRQQVVKLGASRGDRVAILSGVKAGDEVVTAGGFKLKGGSSVEVNNTIQPGNETAPQPNDT